MQALQRSAGEQRQVAWLGKDDFVGGLSLFYPQIALATSAQLHQLCPANP
jgi:hypothetical protein